MEKFSLIYHKKFLSFFVFIVLVFSSFSCFAMQATVLSERKHPSLPRVYKNMVLLTEKDPIYFCVSIPLDIPKEGLTCILVIAGLETGQKNLQYISDPGKYALIGYEYPPILHKEKFSLFDLVTLRKKMLHIPRDILSMAQWAKEQTWSNQTVSIAGYSFGAMFVPAVYDLSQKKDQPLGPGIIAYAGADIYPLLYISLPGSKFTKMIKAGIATLLLKPLEPSRHLPHLKGDFLIINGLQDKKIPWEMAKKLQELTPEPKTIVNINTAHLSPDNQPLLDQINAISKKWLDEKLKQNNHPG